MHQQVHLPKPSRKPVQKKQNKMKEEASNYPSRPQARITRRQFQAEEKPIKLNSTIQEPDPEKVSFLVLPLKRCGTWGKKVELY